MDLKAIDLNFLVSHKYVKLQPTKKL